MKRRIGILTSGGDCPGLNAAIRGVAKAAYTQFDAEIVGIADGYGGLISGEWKEMNQSDFSGLLTLGGTILGSSRRPFKTIKTVEEDNVDKVEVMKKNYQKMRLNCLVVLGGNGTHKSANLLCQNGLDVISLPKTIDNDIFGTDVSFGFHTAVGIATDCIDRVHTTAASHARVIVVEIMGNKAGWLALYSGVAGGADVVLLPEMPYDLQKVFGALHDREKAGKDFSIVAVAEGAMEIQEAQMKRKEREEKRRSENFFSIAHRLSRQIREGAGLESRATVLGYIQRGGSPCAYDRVLATQFGAYAAELIKRENYGNAVAMIGDRVGHHALEDVATKERPVPLEHQLVRVAGDVGIRFGI